MYDSMIFPAPSPPWYDITTFGPALLHIPRVGHDTAAVLIEARGAERIILWAHANAEDLGCTASVAEELSDTLGCSVLAIDYTGYGVVAGAASEEAVTEDAFAAYDFIIRELGFEPHNIIVAGRSIGTGPTAILARTRPVGGVVLVTPFTGIKDCVASLVGSHTNSSTVGALASTMVGNRFPTLEHIVHIESPIVIVHGTDDEIVPYDHGVKLSEAAPGRAQLVTLEGLTHNNIPTHMIAHAMCEKLFPRIRKPAAAGSKKRTGRVVASLHLYSVGDVPPCAPAWALTSAPKEAIARLVPTTRGGDAYKSLVPLLVSNAMTFLNAAILLHDMIKAETKAESAVAISQGPAKTLELALALWGAPWVGVSRAVPHGGTAPMKAEAHTFITGTRRYNDMLRKLQAYKSKDAVPAPALCLLPVYEVAPHKALYAEFEACVKGLRSPKDQPAVYDTMRLQWEIERYARTLPEDCAQRLCEAVDVAGGVVPLPQHFHASLEEVLADPLAQRPESPPVPSAIAEISSAARAAVLPDADSTSPRVEASADVALCVALARAQSPAVGLTGLDRTRSAFVRFKKAVPAVYAPSTDVERRSGKTKKGGGDCCVM